MDDQTKQDQILALMVEQISAQLQSQTSLRWTVDYLFDRNEFRFIARTQLPDGSRYNTFALFSIDRLDPAYPASQVVTEALTVMVDVFKENKRRREEAKEGR